MKTYFMILVTIITVMMIGGCATMAKKVTAEDFSLLPVPLSSTGKVGSDGQLTRYYLYQSTESGRPKYECPVCSVCEKEKQKIQTEGGPEYYGDECIKFDECREQPIKIDECIQQPKEE